MVDADGGGLGIGFRAVVAAVFVPSELAVVADAGFGEIGWVQGLGGEDFGLNADRDVVNEFIVVASHVGSGLCQQPVAGVGAMGCVVVFGEFEFAGDFVGQLFFRECVRGVGCFPTGEGGGFRDAAWLLGFEILYEFFEAVVRAGVVGRGEVEVGQGVEGGFGHGGVVVGERGVIVAVVAVADSSLFDEETFEFLVGEAVSGGVRPYAAFFVHVTAVVAVICVGLCVVVKVCAEVEVGGCDLRGVPLLDGDLIRGFLYWGKDGDS